MRVRHRVTETRCPAGHLAMSRHCFPPRTYRVLLKIIFDKPRRRRYRTGSSNENDYQEGDRCGHPSSWSPARPTPTRSWGRCYAPPGRWSSSTVSTVTWCAGRWCPCSIGVLTTAEAGLELAHGCVSCTIRRDLLVLLRQLHRRDDVDRVVVHLAPWLDPNRSAWPSTTSESVWRQDTSTDLRPWMCRSPRW